MPPKKQSGPGSEYLEQVVKSRLNNAQGGAFDNLTTARADAALYYEGALPPKRRTDHTGYVSMDVLEAVESRKATILETFTGNVKPVQFRALSQQDVQEAEIQTARVNDVLFTENDGYYILHDVLHDALLNRAGITQTYWQKEKVNVPQQVALPDTDTAMAYLSQLGDPETLTDIEIEVDENTQAITLHYTQVADRSRVIVEAVPPEEFYISPRAISLDDADIVARKQVKPLTDLIALGYDVGNPDDYSGNDGYSDNVDYTKAIRFNDIDTGLAVGSDDEYNKKVMVSDCYIKVGYNGRAMRFHVVMADDKMVFSEEVSDHPFSAFVPLRIPHRFWGMPFANQLTQIQEANTVLTRAVVNHSLITTNPRWQIVRNGVPRISELFDNRLGGAVNVSRPDAIAPFPQPNLNPYVMQVMQKLTADKEVTTGTTQLSQGLNKDALSYQNSADLVNQMASMGMQRAKMMARNFERFLASLYMKVSQLLIENDNMARLVQVGGEYAMTNPETWREGRQVAVKFSVGYGEQQKEAADLFAFDQYASSQQGLGGMYGMEQRHNLLTDMMQAKGYANTQRYLIPPEQVPPSQPNPQAVAEQQLKQGELQVKQQLAATAAMKAQADVQQRAQSDDRKTAHLDAQTNLKVHGLEYKQQLDSAKLDLDGRTLAAQTAIDASQIKLEHERMLHDHKMAEKAPPPKVIPVGTK